MNEYIKVRREFRGNYIEDATEKVACECYEIFKLMG